MKIITYIDDLKEFKPWGGATYNYNRIVNAHMSEEFMKFLDEIEPNGVTLTELNDILWFEDNLIDYFLGIDEEELPF